ncbi:MAG: hypothetical protein JHC87_08980, partial [Thermoleophilaceae bacterium]|nr:hypothetical protein [Thermoleophilaceae bacterium]
KLAFERAAAPASVALNTEGTPPLTSLDWAHWGGVGTTLPASPLVPIAKASATEISNATQEGTGTISLATATTLPVITANSWLGGDTTPSATGIKTGIANTGGAVGRGFSFTVPAASANMKTLKLYVGAANTSTTSAQPVKLELFWGASTIPAVVDVLPAFANATNNYVYTINLRHVTAGTTLKVKWSTNTTTTTHRAVLQSAVLLQN